jgi:hypothetical protein
MAVEREPLTVGFPVEQVEAIRRLAEAEDRSISAQIRVLVARALATQGSPRNALRRASQRRSVRLLGGVDEGTARNDLGAEFSARPSKI